jgi:RNA polymerase-associated protein CTR9
VLPSTDLLPADGRPQYETASNRYYQGQNVPALLCLTRSWYAKANKDQSFSAITAALGFARAAQALAPADKSVTYNIAMLEQKAAELLFGVAPAKRSLADLTGAIEQASHAQQ